MLHSFKAILDARSRVLFGDHTYYIPSEKEYLDYGNRVGCVQGLWIFQNIVGKIHKQHRQSPTIRQVGKYGYILDRH